MEKIFVKQRSIVLVPFPFSDQSGNKIRPALVLSNDEFNSKSEDLLVCAITSNTRENKYSIIIDKEDIETGILYDKSSIKAESILKIQKSFVMKTIATIKTSTFSKVMITIFALIKPS